MTDKLKLSNCFAKDTKNGMISHKMGETLAEDLSDKRVLSKICKEL